MSWIHKLYETYNNCQSLVGYSPEEGQRPLLPICHTTAQAHIEIVIDLNGEFKRAQVVPKKQATTILPCTEGSASRSGSKPVNHPLCDKLQYIAGDFVEFGGVVTSGFLGDPLEPHRNYISNLRAWCDSRFSHEKAEAVLKYTNNKSVVSDLAKAQVLIIGSNRKLQVKNDVEQANNPPEIFSVINEQDKALVRWLVESPGMMETKVWRDPSLWESWINYYLSTKAKRPLCYILGENAILTSNHPKYIRREGDGAKIISSNDNSGFTFRGRFLSDEEACNVSLEVSQKAHFALSWLISRQGYNKGDLAIVAWATSGTPIPQPFFDFDDGLIPLVSDEEKFVYTGQEIAIHLRDRVAGYGESLSGTDEIVIIGLDSAIEGKGRLAIIFYRELTGSDFLQRLDRWHETCAWLHNYIFFDKKRLSFIGAPSPSDIVEAAYGIRVDDKLRKATLARILPCIIDGLPIPRDLVESTFRRAINRVGLQNHDDIKIYGVKEYTWEKTLSIACALFNKLNRKESYTMTLDLERKTRDYLYGRLLALADSLEEWALNEIEESRQTNAARLMQRFAERPFSTWRTIELALAPYIARLGAKSIKRQKMIDEVIASFSHDDFINDKRLSGEFLLGFHSQRNYLRGHHAEEPNHKIESMQGKGEI